MYEQRCRFYEMWYALDKVFTVLNIKNFSRHASGMKIDFCAYGIV